MHRYSVVHGLCNGLITGFIKLVGKKSDTGTPFFTKGQKRTVRDNLEDLVPTSSQTGPFPDLLKCVVLSPTLFE